MTATLSADDALGRSAPWWIASAAAVVSFVPAIVLGANGGGVYQNAAVIATVMTMSALLCTIGSAYAMWLSFSNDFEENALVASAMFAGGVLVLAHGLLTPGAFYESNPGFAVSAQLGAVIVVPPLVYLMWGRGRVTRGSAWRLVSVFTAAAGVACAVGLLLVPDAVTPLSPRTGGVAVLIAVGVVVQLLAAAHFVDLAVKFRHSRSLGLGVGLVFNASVPVFFYFGGPSSAAYWWAHGMCVVGVGTAAFTIWLRSRETKVIGDVLAPMLAEKPMQQLQAYQSPRVLKTLRDLDDPNDPRVRQVLRSSRVLAEVAHAKELDPATVLPMLRTLLSGIERPAATTG